MKGLSISVPRFGERSEPERGTEIERRMTLSACSYPAGLFWLLAMQIRASTFKGDRPTCPLDPDHKVHRHGSYDRYANCDDEHDEQKVDIGRFLCLPCGHTISVLPDNFLPYRSVSVPLVQQHFDAQANPQHAQEPPATQKEKGCLKRAWARFKQRVAPLSAVLGQMIRPVKPTAAQLWNQLRRKSNLMAILLDLAKPFNTSLLHDYFCLVPWSSSTG